MGETDSIHEGFADQVLLLVRNQLPNTPGGYIATLSNREKRMKLASDFEKAVGLMGPEMPDVKRIWPGTGRHGAVSAERTHLSTAKEIATVTPSFTSAENVASSIGWYGWAAIGITLAGVTAWFVLRSRKRQPVRRS
jgi:hypothetical protein